MSKKELTALLRRWRKEATSKSDADLLNDILDAVESGELDG